MIRENTAEVGGGLNSVLGTLNVTDTLIESNHATGTAGNISGGGLALQQTETTLQNVTIRDNEGARFGGGILNFVSDANASLGDANLTIHNSTIEGNEAAQGAGIKNQTGTALADASVRVTGSTISSNRSTQLGAGIHSDAGFVLVSHSLIAGNTSGSAGGGVFAQNSELRVENSTLSGNRSDGNTGGAIRLAGDSGLDPDGTGESNTTIVSSTIAFNNSGVTGAITSQAGAGTIVSVTSQNSIFAGNTGSKNFGVRSQGTGVTNFISAGHNLSDDDSGNLIAAGDQINTNPLLLPLADNGGLTRTHALRLESPAIDAGSNALAVDADGNALATDQRGTGFDRILDGTVDVGAFESEFFQGDLIVSSATDIVDNDFSSGQLSLREAVLIANARNGADTITFDATLNGQTITLTDDALTGELQVSESVDIVGPGAENLTVSGNNITGIFWFGDESGASTFNVSGLTLTQGNGETDAGLPSRFGGAVLFFDQFGGDDTLNISDSAIVDNTAVRGGGSACVAGNVEPSRTRRSLETARLESAGPRAAAGFRWSKSTRRWSVSLWTTTPQIGREAGSPVTSMSEVKAMPT